MKKMLNYFEGINGIILIIYTMTIFVLTEYANIDDSRLSFGIRVLIIGVLSIALCPLLIKVCKKIEINQKNYMQTKKQSIAWNVLYFIIPFAVFLYHYLIFYPGSFSNDTFEQIGYCLSNQYSDWHPVMQTLFAIKMPLVLTNGWVGSMILFQIVFFSLAICYATKTIEENSNKLLAFVFLSIILLNPQTTNIAMFPWKDVSFAIGTLVLMSFALKIFSSKGKWLTKKRNFIAYVFFLVFTTLMRHNAILFTAFLILATIFFMPKKNIYILVLSFVLVIFVVKIPVYSLMNVIKPNERQIETLGLPMTVIGAVTKYNPDALDEETKEFAYKVSPKEIWEEVYQYGNYNWVKWNDKTNNTVIEEYGAKQVIAMMIRTLKNSPRVALTGLIKLTEVVYTISDYYSYVDFPYPSQDTVLGDTKDLFENSEILRESKQNYTMYINKIFPMLFVYVGAMHLYILIAILSKCQLNLWEDWKKIFFALPLLAYNFGTALLLTSAHDSSRFFYYTFLITPLVLLLFFKNDEIEKREEQ